MKLLQDFTICNSFKVKGWNDGSLSGLYPWQFKYVDHWWGDMWGYSWFYASPKHSALRVVLRFGGRYTQYRYLKATKKAPIYYPHSWVKWCFSLNTTSGKAAIVMDGMVLEDSIREDFIVNDTVWALTPDNLSIHFGKETHAQFTDFNIWSEPLALERLIAITENGGEECGALGDWLSWDADDWTLHNPNGSQVHHRGGPTLGLCIDYGWEKCMLEAKWLEVNEAQGPCWRKSALWLFWIPFNVFHQSYCMEFCEKLGTRSPPVRTLGEWQWWISEVNSVRLKQTIRLYLHTSYVPPARTLLKHCIRVQHPFP